MADYINLTLEKGKISAISALGLAHLGDAVFELMVRAWLCAHGKSTSKGLHHATVSYVAAPAQAKAIQRIMPTLTDEETSAYKRGRNARVNSIPQNCTPGDYHAATGLETLFGYLYLNGKTDRLNELFEIIMEEK